MPDLSAQQVGTQVRPAATQPRTHVNRGMNEFPMSYLFANTARYGDITPFYWQESRGDDEVPLQSEHSLNTYTLGSPLKSDVNMYKTYFQVDMQAIYPRNWDKLWMEPNKGDDIPEDARCVVRHLLRCCQALASGIRATSNLDSLTASQVTNYLKILLFFESIFSTGSLFSQFNIHLDRFFVSNDSSSFDDFFDSVIESIFGQFMESSAKITIDGRRYSVTMENESYYDVSSSIYYTTSHHLLELMRENEFDIDLNGSTVSYFSSMYSFNVNGISNFPLNLEIIVGYQLGCLQFFSDSHIDSIYDARLYRDMMQSYAYLGIGNVNIDFDYNGVYTLYDIFSGHIIDGLLDTIESFTLSSTLTVNNSSAFNFFQNLFSIRKSLRYGDYFVSSRPNPLGIGDVNVDTSGESVSVVDITKKIQYQRFLNAVNLAMHKVGDYARKVLGLDNADDVSYDIPSFLAHQRFSISGFEVENTGSDQRNDNSVTTLLRSTVSTNAFYLKTKRPCLIYGVQTFDVPRIYSQTIDRIHFRENRYDDFIPQNQYIGDQSIYLKELDPTRAVSDEAFAYTLRYMEYKIRVNYAAGGVINKLKSWFFVSDNRDGNPPQDFINPDFIRSSNSEFDRFYTSLSGYSIGNYFHFIIMNKNYQTLTRKMDYAPEPLK